MKNRHLNNFLIYCVFIFFSFAQAQSPRVTINILSNLNGAISDCFCNDGPSGSLARYSTYLKNNPGQINILNGDFLTTYLSPNYNNFIVDVLSTLPFDLIVLGDQDLIHGDLLIKKLERKFKVLQPRHISQNSYYHIIRQSNIEIILVNVWEEALVPKSKKNNAYSHIERLFRKYDQMFRICFFHGSREAAIQFRMQFPSVDVLVVNHDYSKSFVMSEVDKVIFGGGAEGEDVLLLNISKKNKTYYFTPRKQNLSKEYEEDPDILYLYHQYQKNYERGN